jgi:hypothetical protein
MPDQTEAAMVIACDILREGSPADIRRQLELALKRIEILTAERDHALAERDVALAERDEGRATREELQKQIAGLEALLVTLEPEPPQATPAALAARQKRKPRTPQNPEMRVYKPWTEAEDAWLGSAILPALRPAMTRPERSTAYASIVKGFVGAFGPGRSVNSITIRITRLWPRSA